MKKMFLIMETQNKISINDMHLWILVTIISSMFFAFIDVLTFLSIFNIKSTKMKVVSASLTDALIRFITIMLVPIPYYRALYIVFVTVIFKIFFKQKIEKCILGEVINTIIIVSMEGIFSKMFCELFSDVESYADGMYNYKYKFCITMSIGISRLIIYYIIKKKNIIIKMTGNMKKTNKQSIIVASVLGMTVIFFNSFEMTMYITDFPYIIFILDIASIIICFYISIKSIVRVTKLEEQDMKIHNLESYNKTLSIMYDSIRGFRHDFCNFVQALDGYVQTNNMKGIQEMNKAILKDCTKVNNMSILDPSIINNPAVYSIIINKYYLAQENGIEMNIEVMVDLKDININNYELCRILAILLDNAIEAAKECDEKIINVRFIKDLAVKRKLIVIENSYLRHDIDIDKIFEKGYTTKENPSDKHGLGLWTVRRILNQSTNLNLFTTKGKVFSQQLEIYE